MGRDDTYRRQRAHVVRENPKFFALGENGGPPSRIAVAEEFHRLIADNAYGRNPKAGAERPEGGVILISPPLRATDPNTLGMKINASDTLSPGHASKDAVKKVKNETGAKPKTKRPEPKDIVLEPKEIINFDLAIKDDEETPTTAGFDWSADLAAHQPHPPDEPAIDLSNEENIFHEELPNEEGWSTVRSNRSNRDRRSTILGQDENPRGCFNCGQEGHRKTECPNPPKSGGRACHKCHEEGHFARECPNQVEEAGGYASNNARVCFNCQGTGHISRDCPVGGPGKGGAGCFNCGEPGHKSFECPKGESGKPSRFGKPGGGGGGGCYKCGQTGHFARECNGGSGGPSDFGTFEGHEDTFTTGVDAGFDAGFGDGFGTTANDDDGYAW